MAGIINSTENMYEERNDEMKQTIAKAGSGAEPKLGDGPNSRTVEDNELSSLPDDLHLWKSHKIQLL